MAAGSLLAVLALGVLLSVLLWLAIDSETNRTDVMDRDSAERAARADTPGPGRSRTRPGDRNRANADHDRRDD